MKQAFRDSSKFNLVIALLMAYCLVSDLVHHRWAWVVAYTFLFGVNVWVALPPYARRLSYWKKP